MRFETLLANLDQGHDIRHIDAHFFLVAVAVTRHDLNPNWEQGRD